MDFIEFSRSEILILSKILRLVRKETGLPLKMQSENLLVRLDTAITACHERTTHQLYQQFLNTFSQPDILLQLGITEKNTSEGKAIYRGKTIANEKPTKETDADVPKGKRKVVYRGQVKYVD